MPKLRNNSNKKLKPVLHIFCEGEKTEPNYLHGYLKKFHANNRLLKVIKVEKTTTNTPVQLVQEAIKLKNDRVTTDADSFWVVYDRESKAKYSDGLHRKALDQARSKGIEVSITSVCFEVWLLLHFDDLTAPYASCDDLLKRSTLKAELKRLGIRQYDKADNKIFDLIVDEIPTARMRAVKMNAAILAAAPSNVTEESPHLLNPYTRVHLLLDAIDDFVNNS